MIAKMRPVALKAIRESKHLSKTQLARLAEMQPGTIGWIETGRFIPYKSQLEKIAKVLDVNNPLDLLEQE